MKKVTFLLALFISLFCFLLSACSPADDLSTGVSTSATGFSTSNTSVTLKTTITTTTTQSITTTTSAATTSIKTTIKKTTTKKTSVKTIQTERPTSTSTSRKVIQAADPKTGISWDGKSKIIYTYPDGTTGTEPKDGAKYERYPGEWSTYTTKRDFNGRVIGSICEICGKEINYSSRGIYCVQNSFLDYYCECCGERFQPGKCHTCKKVFESNSFGKDTFYCNHCGKVSGDGKNGTCTRLLFSDGECSFCGVFLKMKTCHTCEAGCRYCKKPLGDGSNGTCFRYPFAPKKCPSCGVMVETDKCHSCKKK